MRKMMLAAFACVMAGFLGWTLIGILRAEEPAPTPAPAPAGPAVLFDFEDEDNLAKWETKEGTEATLSTDHATSGKKSLKLVLTAGGEYPGMTTSKLPVKDWSGCASLKFDVFADEPFKLMMTIKDPNSKNYATRYNNDKINVEKGASTITITLGDVGDKIDLKKVQQMTIFAGKPEKAITFYLDNIRLEK